MAFDSEDGSNSRGVAYLLWLSCLFGFCGLHRFYLGRPLSGIAYVFTLGFFGVGQVIDLFRMPQLVAEENARHAARLAALAERRGLPAAPDGGMVAVEAPEQLRVKLVQAAARHGGRLSVTQGVMATGKTFEEVEALLTAMVKSGYVGIDNDEKTGVVVYTFGELA
jgi:TM2 domain-containing membrane protein YozV